MDIRRFLRLEVLVPGLLLAAFVCDAACRFVRVDALSFRAEECVSQFPSAWLPGPYEPNRHIQKERTSGELATMSNQQEYRAFRDQAFTTDNLGFRNETGHWATPPSVLMVGTSFTIGVGNSDRQTLPNQVGAISGCPTYNAGGLEVRSESILRVARNLGMHEGLIIVECLERYVGDPIHRGKGRLKWLPYRDDLLAIYQTIKTRLEISPVQIAVRQIYKSFQNDRILPNVEKEWVPVRPLRDGRPMLFHLYLEKPLDDRITENVDAYTKIRDDLKAAGFDLALVIVPDKLTVYGSLLREPLDGDGKSLALLADLEHACRDRDLSIVNLAPILVDGARQAFEKGEIIYWADDTHWNPQGIDIAARAICDAFDLRARCMRKPEMPRP